MDDRQLEAEAGALPGRRAQPQRAAEVLDDGAADGQAQPVPCGRFAASPPWRNFSNTSACCPGGTPGPLSCTSTTSEPARGCSRTLTRPPSAGTNLAALDSRFNTTCSRRSGSARSSGTRSGLRSSSTAPRSRNSSEVVCTAWSSSVPRSTSADCQSAWPDSIFAMSSTWLTRRDSRSDSDTTRPRKCWRCAASIAVVAHQLGQCADAGQRRAAARASPRT